LEKFFPSSSTNPMAWDKRASDFIIFTQQNQWILARLVQQSNSDMCALKPTLFILLHSHPRCTFLVPRNRDTYNIRTPILNHVRHVFHPSLCRIYIHKTNVIKNWMYNGFPSVNLVTYSTY
jgi:hypothetical protein